MRAHFRGTQELPSSATRSANRVRSDSTTTAYRRGVPFLPGCKSSADACRGRVGTPLTDPAEARSATGRSGALFVFIHRRHAEMDRLWNLLQLWSNQAWFGGPPTLRPAWLTPDWTTVGPTVVQLGPQLKSDQLGPTVVQLGPPNTLRLNTRQRSSLRWPFGRCHWLCTKIRTRWMPRARSAPRAATRAWRR